MKAAGSVRLGWASVGWVLACSVTRGTLHRTWLAGQSGTGLRADAQRGRVRAVDHERVVALLEPRELLDARAPRRQLEVDAVDADAMRPAVARRQPQLDRQERRDRDHGR